MPPVVAIELNGSNAFFISGEMTTTGTVSFKASRLLDLAPDLSDTDSESSSEESPAEANPESDVEITTGAEDKLVSSIISELIDDDSIATIFAVSDTNQILYQLHSLPFNDSKKIEQVAPLQVQDLVPFEVDDFLFHNLILGSSTNGSYPILSSLIPAREVGRVLRRLGKVGAEPHILTTKASALLGLANLFPEQLSGNYAVLAVSTTHCSIILVDDNVLQYLADIDIPSVDHQPDIETVAKQLLCAIRRVEREIGSTYDSIYCTGPKDSLLKFFEFLDRNPVKLNLDAVVENESSLDQQLENLSWAVGLIASEGAALPQKLVDFRRGPYSYRPTFGNFISALKDELIFIIIAVLMTFGYCGARIYTEMSELSTIDATINSQFQQALNQPAPAGEDEVTYLMTKIADTTDQLEEVGSLSTLSPLNFIKELSSRIGKDLEIEITLMNIGQEEISFEGIVPNTPAVGKLDNILKGMNNLFCKVEVNPLGKQPGKGDKVRAILRKTCDSEPS